MSISDSTNKGGSRVARDVAWLAALGTAAAVLLSPADPALSSWPVHPCWALAMLAAARYGARGLALIPALALGVAIADLLAGESGLTAADRLSLGGDLAALTTVALCAATGTAHEHRRLVLEQRASDLEARAASAETIARDLSEMALALHDHRERSSTSLSFLIDITTRMTAGNSVEAAGAALALALARTGARDGFVASLDRSGAVRILAARGSVCHDDRTAAEAAKRRAVVFAHDIADARSADSDVAAPMVGPKGKIVGVIALRGVPFTTLSATLAAELACVARWAMPALAGSRARRTPRSVATPDYAELTVLTDPPEPPAPPTNTASGGRRGA